MIHFDFSRISFKQRSRGEMPPQLRDGSKQERYWIDARKATVFCAMGEVKAAVRLFQ
jgi:hypothetical protein